MENNLSYKYEVYRKLFHLNALWICFLYSILSYEVAVKLLIICALLSVIIDILKYKSKILGDIIISLLGKIMRPHEKSHKLALSGISYLMIAALLTIIFFSKEVAICAFAILAISDTAAALIGKKIGKHIILPGKSVEGFLAFSASGILTVIIITLTLNLTNYFLIFSLISVIIAAVCETWASKFKIDDNLIVPLSFGFSVITIARLYSWVTGNAVIFTFH